MKEPEIIFAASSPNGNMTAFVDQDDRVANFSLVGSSDTGSSFQKGCWIRNLRAAPAWIEEPTDARSTPMMPREFCRHPDGAPPFRGESEFRVVWFEEGDAAALIEGDSILAIVPAWSGFKQFHGYARDCIGESPFASELDDSNLLIPRIHRAEEFWRSWEESPGPWPQIQENLLSAIGRQIGPEHTYYGIDGGKWPPKALLRIELETCVVLVTIGVSIRPQPTVEMTFEDPSPYRRIELGICLSKEAPEETVNSASQYIADQTLLPWGRCTWFGDGHSLPCDAFVPGHYMTDISSVLLLKDPKGAPTLELPPYRNDPVGVLWIVGITEKERRVAMRHGSQELVTNLSEAGIGWVNRDRGSKPWWKLWYVALARWARPAKASSGDHDEQDLVVTSSVHPVTSRQAVFQDNGTIGDFCLLTPQIEGAEGTEIEVRCWVYNRVPAPAVTELQKFRNRAPPAAIGYTVAHHRQHPPEIRDIRFQWSKNGESVALHLKGVVVAYISLHVSEEMQERNARSWAVSHSSVSRDLAQPGPWGVPWDEEDFQSTFRDAEAPHAASDMP